MTRVYLDHMNQFIYKPMTPNTIYQMEAALGHVQRHLFLTDGGNPIWEIPVKIVVTSPGTFELQLQLDNVEIIG